MNLEIQNKRLKWLLDIGHTMIHTRDLPHLLKFITESFAQLSKTSRTIILLVDPITNLLIQRAVLVDGDASLNSSHHQMMTFSTQVLKDKKSSFTSTSTQYMIGIPLEINNKIIGILYAESRKNKSNVHFRSSQNLYEIFAHQAAFAIENAQLFQNAINDALTGLPNCSYFLNELKKQTEFCPKDSTYGILICDLDQFKRVNRAAGAETGDQALIDISNTLRELIRTDGFLARYGSDKFAILLPPDDAISIDLRLRDVAERTRAAIAAKHYSGVQLSACIGGVSLPRENVSKALDAVAIADDCLRAARFRGQGEIEIY